MVAAFSACSIAAMDVVPALLVPVNSKSDAELTQQLRDEYVRVRNQYQYLDRTENIGISPCDGFLMYDDMIYELVKKLDMDMPYVYIYKGIAGDSNDRVAPNGSTRTNASAQQPSISSRGAIIIGEALITDPEYALTYSELEAVIAHELAHIKHAHMPTMTQWVNASHAAASLAAIATLYVYSHDLYNYLGHANKSWLFGLFTKYRAMSVALWPPLTWALYAPFLPLNNVLLRRQEQEADTTAMKVISDPMAIGRALEKIEKMRSCHNDWFSNLRKKLPFFFRTHPALADRKKCCEQAAVARLCAASVV